MAVGEEAVAEAGATAGSVDLVAAAQEVEALAETGSSLCLYGCFDLGRVVSDDR